MAMAGVGLISAATAAALLLALVAAPAAAQTITLVELDPVYERGDKIVISGSVEPRVGEIPVTIQVKRGSNVIAVDQLKVSRDGSFATIINTDGDVWEVGAHSVQAAYQQGATARQEFEISSMPVEAGPEAVEGASTVDLGDGEEGRIQYTITGGTVTDMALSREGLGLTVYVSAESAGTISLTASRAYFDARADGCEGADEEFIVIVDGRQVDHTVERGESENVIGVDFFEDEGRIQIVGTCVIPEFGAAAVALAAASAAAVAAAGLGARGRTFA